MSNLGNMVSLCNLFSDVLFILFKLCVSPHLPGLLKIYSYFTFFIPIIDHHIMIIASYSLNLLCAIELTLHEILNLN